MSRPVAFALAVVAAYMLVRCGVYAAMPVRGFASWMTRDALMSLPRLAGFAACAAELLVLAAVLAASWRALGEGRAKPVKLMRTPVSTR